MRMNGADALLRSLEAEGVDTVFGIPGGAILPTYDALARGTTIRHVLARHEQGAGHAATGFAQATGKVGVCIATSGPGATNLVTPIADANMDSVPLVAITGQVGQHMLGTDAFQEADIRGVTMPITKHNFMVTSPEDIPAAIAEAFHVASTGRPGAVLVDIPKDVQNAALSFSGHSTLPIHGYRRRLQAVQDAHLSDADCAAFFNALRAARRPLIYAGGGVAAVEAAAALRDFVQAFGLPVTTTLMGLGAIDTTAPLAYTHNRVEGRSEYTQLLYIPAKAPFDLWNRDKRGGVKLYVKRVFIMDDAEALMPVYLRFVKGVIDSADLPLFRYIGGPNAHVLPVPMMNILNGGSHADSNVDIQEFMVAPIGPTTYREALRTGAEVYHSLKSVLKSKGLSTGLGDEGGFAPNLPSNRDALDLILVAIEKAGFTPGTDVALALDVAATEFYKDGAYQFEGKATSAAEMIAFYEKLVADYPLVSIEDPLDEDAWEDWSSLVASVGDRVQIVVFAHQHGLVP